MPRIAVFAGHGGSDFGAVANGVYEKNLNLAISNALSDTLRRMGYEVINNRTTDVERSIPQDAQLANSQNVNALIEIHMNSNEGTPATGSEVFYSVKDTGKGRELADAILQNLAELGFYNRGAKVNVNAAGQDTFGILRLTNMPANLVEVAFINNPLDIQRLNVTEVADAIAEAVTKVFPLTTPAPTPPAPPVVPGWDTVIRGIQSTLNQRYNFGLAVDGIAGPATRTAIVKGLQIELNRQFGRNLVVDGIFGPQTRAATVNVRPGARGNMTFLIQAALFLRGFTEIVPDGFFGPVTEQAVRLFQSAGGLVSDGIAGPLTQERLFSW